MSPKKIPAKQASVPGQKSMRPCATSRPTPMQVRSSLIRVAEAISTTRITSAKPVAVGIEERSKGSSALATRAGSASARVGMLPASTCPKKSSIRSAVGRGSMKTMKWSSSSISSSLWGTIR